MLFSVTVAARPNGAATVKPAEIAARLHAQSSTHTPRRYHAPTQGSTRPTFIDPGFTGKFMYEVHNEDDASDDPVSEALLSWCLNI